MSQDSEYYEVCDFESNLEALENELLDEKPTRRNPERSVKQIK